MATKVRTIFIIYALFLARLILGFAAEVLKYFRLSGINRNFLE